jgi:cation diffusion facilitator family transporter
MQDGSKKAIIAAFLANAAIAVAKFVGFLLTGAASMLAEAVHSSADAGNQGLLFLGGARARKTATPEHPFGYGRERYFWSFVVALVLFTLGGLFALFEGIEKLRHPHEIESATVAFVILTLAIIVEAFSFRTAIKESLHVKGKETWWQFIRRSKTPELPVVLLEDLGALTGLVFAVVGLGMAEITGNPRWDAVGSIAIGVLLVIIAVILVIEMKGLLIGEAATPATIANITRTIESTDRVEKVLHLRTQHLGPDELLVCAKLAFDSAVDLDTLATAINEVEHRVREAVPTARVIYIEPDIERSATPS